MKSQRIFLALPFSLLCLMIFSCTSNTSNTSSTPSGYPPLDKKVCVIDNDVFYAIQGNLEAFIYPLLKGPNLIKTEWEETNGIWNLKIIMQDPAKKEKHQLELTFAPTEAAPDYICVTRVLADGEEAGSGERADLVLQIAQRAGLKHEW